jgi:thioredoxin-dependent peroxiredoxin
VPNQSVKVKFKTPTKLMNTAQVATHPESPNVRTTLRPGDPAPDFRAIAVGGEFGDGNPMQLRDYFGEQIVLYFYPQDNTPGCTTQACKLRDEWSEFGSRASLFGVSIDPPESHREVIELLSLPFPLISDVEKKIVRAYGLWMEQSEGGEGENFRTERTTFVIAPNGIVKTVLRKVDPHIHDRLLLEALYA